MPRPLLPLVALLLPAFWSVALAPTRAEEPAPARPQPADEQAVAAEFGEKIKPFFVKYCQRCHSGDEPEGELSLEGYLQRGTLVADRQTWEKVTRKLHDREMP